MRPLSAESDLKLCQQALGKLREVKEIFGQVDADPPSGWCADEALYHLDQTIGMLALFDNYDDGGGEPERPRLRVVGGRAKPLRAGAKRAPDAEAFARLERQAQWFFRCAIEAAVAVIWDEAKGRDLGSLRLDELYRIMGRALEDARSRASEEKTE